MTEPSSGFLKGGFFLLIVSAKVKTEDNRPTGLQESHIKPAMETLAEVAKELIEPIGEALSG